VTTGWQKWVGAEGEIIGVDRLARRPRTKQFTSQFGLTPERIVERALAVIERFS